MAASPNNCLIHRPLINKKFNNNHALLTSFDSTNNKFVPVLERILEILLYRFRWVFVILFILPASIIYDSFYTLRNWAVFQLKSASKSHDRKVLRIQQQIREWNKNGRKQKLCTARPGYLTMCFRFPKYKKFMLGIKTDQLVDILEINTEKNIIRVEPMVTMGQLTRFLLPLGFTLPIVPELEDLTVGGMINGCGVESSGRKYGLFQHTCISFELVTSSGELIVVNKNPGNKHQTLFYGIPWSHGTLGFLVAATIRIIPCKPYVCLHYQPCHSTREISQKLCNESSLNKNEFVEGIQFSEQSGCIISGYFIDEIPKGGKLNAIGKWYKPWYFKHVENIYLNNKSVIEYIPLRDYYHRHSKSIFWEIQNIIPFGNNLLFRYLFGWASPPKIALLKLTMPRAVKNIYERIHVLQDLFVPVQELEKSIKFLQQKIYPLWLCPFNLPSQPGLLRNRSGMNKLFVNIGIYGNCTLSNYNPIETIRTIEKYVRSVEGAQLLYADCYQSCAEFWEMFDASLYDWLRAKYDCKTAFPTVYEKICRESKD